MGIFFLACLGVWGYQIFYVWPRDKCENAGNWYDTQSRQCGKVIYIPDYTGRIVKNGQEERVVLPKGARAAPPSAPAASGAAAAAEPVSPSN